MHVFKNGLNRWSVASFQKCRTIQLAKFEMYQPLKQAESTLEMLKSRSVWKSKCEALYWPLGNIERKRYIDPKFIDTSCESICTGGNGFALIGKIISVRFSHLIGFFNIEWTIWLVFSHMIFFHTHTFIWPHMQLYLSSEECTRAYRNH